MSNKTFSDKFNEFKNTKVVDFGHDVGIEIGKNLLGLAQAANIDENSLPYADIDQGLKSKSDNEAIKLLARLAAAGAITMPVNKIMPSVVATIPVGDVAIGKGNYLNLPATIGLLGEIGTGVALNKGRTENQGKSFGDSDYLKSILMQMPGAGFKLATNNPSNGFVGAAGSAIRDKLVGKPTTQYANDYDKEYAYNGGD